MWHTEIFSKPPLKPISAILLWCSRCSEFRVSLNLSVQYYCGVRGVSEKIALNWVQLLTPGRCSSLHTQRNIFEIFVKPHRNHIVITILRLISFLVDPFSANRHCPFAVPNQSENGKYYLISVLFNQIWKIFLCVQLAITPK